MSVSRWNLSECVYWENKLPLEEDGQVMKAMKFMF